MRNAWKNIYYKSYYVFIIIDKFKEHDVFE
jgi:hypothetical protein